MQVMLKPIGFVQTENKTTPRHWTVSDVEGILVLDEQYVEGLRDIQIGDRIVVIFHFHKSRPFSQDFLIQKPPHKDRDFGVFSICSPIRPNPIGLSVLNVLDRQQNVLRVKGIDMIDGTPILDIKPHIEAQSE
jgi:tRNA-Thr(GGU) m(6)t(6)A37 methyltransferase TsaA